MYNKNLIAIIEGPGGVGKDSILLGLINKYPDSYERFITVTTRAMREGECEGRPYNFVSEEVFNKRRQSGDIFEHTFRHGTYRGMSKRLIDKVLVAGKTAVGSCDILGMPHLKKIYGKRAVFIFIKAPREEVEKRLIQRGDSKEDRESRLREFDNYLKSENKYDYSVINNNLNEAIEDVHCIVQQHFV